MTAPAAAPRADAEGVSFSDGHEHDWEPQGAHVWVCSLCGGWTHHPPLARAVDAYDDPQPPWNDACEHMAAAIRALATDATP